jgi:2,3-bisphosphoglycerate-independent phosphoglycerate mutase
MGILSDAGSQGHQEIIYALIKAGINHHIKKIVIHAFLDGRDVAPKSAAHYLEQLENYIRPYSCIIGSITGRSYAMDRDKNWDRTRATYDMLTQQTELRFTNWHEALASYYGQDVTDEFIPPTSLAKYPILDGDGILYANFREDRARQLTACFIAPALTPLTLKPLVPAFFISTIRYDQRFENPVLLEIKPVSGTLKEILSTENKTIFSIAETEKYAHITYFFADGREKPFKHETRVIIPSLLAQSYAQHPEMSAQKITDAVIHSLQTQPCDFYLINYANADMVGHSGNMAATIKAIECLDHQIKQLYDQIVRRRNGTLYITADHGNAELMFDESTGQPHTGHTTDPVPFIWIKNGLKKKDVRLDPLHGLADIAPFILSQI